MKKAILVFVIITILVFSSCTTANLTTRYIAMDYEQKFEQKDIIDAITYVLVNNRFEIETINETYGLVTTKWKDLGNLNENLGKSLVLSMLKTLGGGPTTTIMFRDAVMLTFRLSENKYVVFPQQSSISSESSIFKSNESTSTAFSPTEESSIGQLVNKIITEINNLLGLSVEIIWEKEIDEQ
jgi:hypothetical protein